MVVAIVISALIVLISFSESGLSLKLRTDLRLAR
jgi:hypothetical protein